MKNKILSIALVLGILLSIISSIPVSAENNAAKSLPYAFYDNEDGVVAMQGGIIADGGMGESEKCMNYTENSQTYTDCLIYSSQRWP